MDDKEVLKKPLCEPLVKKVDLRFDLGIEVTARNLKGVTIKDALDAIHKQYKKKVSFVGLSVGGWTGARWNLVAEGMGGIIRTSSLGAWDSGLSIISCPVLLFILSPSSIY